jgi:dTDP-glucose 4,6-dehydratase
MSSSASRVLRRSIAGRLLFWFLVIALIPCAILTAITARIATTALEKSVRDNLVQIAAGKRRIRLGALSPTRDFNFVADTVNGFLAALRSDAGIGEAVTLGSNYEISVGDTARLIAEVMGSEIEIDSDESRLRPVHSEVERLWASNARAKELFGWSPAYGGIDGFRRGLTETAAWFSNADNLAGYKVDLYNI